MAKAARAEAARATVAVARAEAARATVAVATVAVELTGSPRGSGIHFLRLRLHSSTDIRFPDAE